MLHHTMLARSQRSEPVRLHHMQATVSSCSTTPRTFAWSQQTFLLQKQFFHFCALHVKLLFEVAAQVLWRQLLSPFAFHLKQKLFSTPIALRDAHKIIVQLTHLSTPQQSHKTCCSGCIRCY